MEATSSRGSDAQPQETLDACELIKTSKVHNSSCRKSLMIIDSCVTREHAIRLGLNLRSRGLFVIAKWCLPVSQSNIILPTSCRLKPGGIMYICVYVNTCGHI